MEPIELTVTGDVAIVTLNRGDNRFDPDLTAAFGRVLDEVETDTNAAGLVVSSGHPTIFSNGLDLVWIRERLQADELPALQSFFHGLNALLVRLLTYPMITVAAVSGHAFGAGAILACTCDLRLMRADRGFFCLPEIDLKIPLLPGYIALLRKAVPGHLLGELLMTGRRLGGAECAAHGIVSRTLPPGELPAAALDLAASQAKDRFVVAEMRRRLCRDVIATLETEDAALIDRGEFHIPLDTPLPY